MAKSTARITPFSYTGPLPLSEQAGAASISPSARDLVLVSRSGLRVVDLDDPLFGSRSIPYPVPTGVFDVQWSPHAFRDSWILSTAGPSAVLWDVASTRAQDPIVEELKGHSRSISDINFSAHHPEILATCSIDSFVFLWDVRTPAQPAIKLADWHESASQVKFNRQDEHILASAHGGHFDIWDDRKGSLPLKSIEAHSTKIYGIDWHREHRENILTCSLDKTIKLWNWTRIGHSSGDEADDPIDRVIRTKYPVWRARYTPFGHGILAMPQRCDTELHLYDSRTYRLADRDAEIDPVHSFGGHLEPVKEFLWRQRGGIENGHDLRDFQLVSMSADQTIRLRTPHPETLAKVGFRKGDTFDSPLRFTRKNAVYRSFAFQQSSADIVSNATSSAETQLFHRTYHHFPVLPSEHRNHAQLSVQKAAEIEDQDKIFDNISTGHQTLEPERFQLAGTSPLDMATASELSSLAGVAGEERGSGTSKPYSIPNGSNQGGTPRSSSSFHTSNPLASKTDGSMRRQSDTGTTSIDGSFDSHRRPSQVILEGTKDDIELSDLFDEEEEEDDEDDAVIGAFIRPTRALRLDNKGSITIKEEVRLPPPRTCAARWCPNGSLLCFFPAKHDNAVAATQSGPNFRGVASWFAFPVRRNRGSTFEGSRTSSSNSLDESSDPFGASVLQNSTMLFEDPRALPQNGTVHAQMEERRTNAELPMPNDREWSGGERQTTATAAITPGKSMSFGTPVSQSGMTVPRYTPMASGSVQTGATAAPRPRRTNKPSSFISVQNLAGLLPSKEYLANEYTLTGDVSAICVHNEEVCRRYNLLEHSQAWQDAATLLQPTVPVQSIRCTKYATVSARQDSAAVAKSIRDGSKDANSTLRYLPVQWRRNHPLGSRKIDKMMNQFESQRDEQMLAMLSFVFREDSGIHDQLGSASSSAAKTTDFTNEGHDEAIAMDSEPIGRSSPESAIANVKSVAVKRKNEHRFNMSSGRFWREGPPNMTELTKHCTWRERYAELLYSWGLYEARAQMLKANGKYAVGGAELETSLDAAEGRSVVAECGICFARIKGDAKFCSTAAHTMHQRCFELYETHEGIEASNECPFGCSGLE